MQDRLEASMLEEAGHMETIQLAAEAEKANQLNKTALITHLKEQVKELEKLPFLVLRDGDNIMQRTILNSKIKMYEKLIEKIIHGDFNIWT